MVLTQPFGCVNLEGMADASPILSPRRRHTGGTCGPGLRSVPATAPSLDLEQTAALAATAKALGDPTRLRIVDVIRQAAPEAVCQCELLPLFQMSQPALAKHLRVLVDAGVLQSERRGTWTFYYARPDGLKGLTTWLA